MKKMFTAILATVLMTLGLVTTTSTAAQAACPYSACIPTTTTATHPGTITGSAITIKVKVKATGSGTPTGTVRVGIKKYNNAFKVVQTKPYTGGKISFDFTGLPKKGKYRVVAKFIPASGSVYLSSKSRTTFIVSSL